MNCGLLITKPAGKKRSVAVKEKAAARWLGLAVEFVCACGAHARRKTRTDQFALAAR